MSRRDDAFVQSVFAKEAENLRVKHAMRKSAAKRNREQRARRVLTEAQVREGLTLDADALKVLEDMSRGKAPRNAQSILGAIRLRLDFTAQKPKSEVEHSGGLSIQVNTLASPSAQALPPVVRKPELDEPKEAPEESQAGEP